MKLKKKISKLFRHFDTGLLEISISLLYKDLDFCFFHCKQLRSKLQLGKKYLCERVDKALNKRKKKVIIIIRINSKEEAKLF